MGRYVEGFKKWVNYQIQESLAWQASNYLPRIGMPLLMKWLVTGIFYQTILCYFFYRTWKAWIFLLPISLCFSFLEYKNWQQKIQSEIEQGFKEWLGFLKGELSTGKSMEQAISLSRGEFLKYIGENHPVLLGLNQLYRGMEWNVPVEKLLVEMGEETKVDSVSSFARIFTIVKRKGGSMIHTLDRSMEQIRDKIDLNQEIYYMIKAKKLEQKIMNMMPLGILLFMKGFGEGYLHVLYHGWRGRMIMSIGLLLYLGGIVWGTYLVREL